MVRQIFFFKDYFLKFYENQTENVQKKIDYVLDLVTNVERVPEKFLKHLENTDNLYEIRIQQNKNIFRIFCCFDKEKIVVLFNGFQKKTNRTPKNELEKAESLKQEYFNEQRETK